MRRASLAAVVLFMAPGCPSCPTARELVIVDTGPKSPRAAPKPVVPATPLADYDNPSFCAPCHASVYEEWQQSMHARSHHKRDPIYAAVRGVRMKKEGADIAKACASCHSPRAVEAPESTVAVQGVHCASCHNVQEVKRGPGLFGAKALVPAAANLMLGPHEVKFEAVPHGTGAPPEHMKDGASLCLACHDRLENPEGVPLCSTGVEWAEAKGEKKSCVECHMPMIDAPSGEAAGERKRHRSHAFLGPHQAWYQDDASFLRGSVLLETSLDGRTLKVTLTNQSRHSFPSGFPGRFAVLQVVGFGTEEQEVWKSFADNPMKESPEAVFNKVYLDADGQPTLAPYAEKLARDSRLAGGEVRTLTFDLPEDVTHAAVKLFYRLMAPPLAKKLNLAKSKEASGKVIALETVKISSPGTTASPAK